MEELEEAKRLEVSAKIEERKKRAEVRKGFNDVTDMAKLNSDYNIDDALIFIEGRLHKKQKATGKNLKKDNKELEKKKQNTKEKAMETALVVKEVTEVERLKEGMKPSQTDEKVKVCNALPKNKCKTKKSLTEKSNSTMFDEIVGDIIDELGNFERSEKAKIKKSFKFQNKSNSTVEKTENKDMETKELFDVVETGYWTKVGGTNLCNKKRKVKVKELTLAKPQLFTVVDVEHENLKNVNISDKKRTILAKNECQNVNVWMETKHTLPENQNKVLSEEDFPSLQSMLGKKRSPKKGIEKVFPPDFDKEVEYEKVKVVEGEVGPEAEPEMYEEEDFSTEVELKESARTNLEEVNLKNLSIQEEVEGEDQLEDEKVEEQDEKQDGKEDLAKNENKVQEVMSENQNEIQGEVSVNQNLKGVSENQNEEEVSGKPMQIQMTRMHAMLSGLIVPFGQF